MKGVIEVFNRYFMVLVTLTLVYAGAHNGLLVYGNITVLFVYSKIKLLSNCGRK